MASIVQDSSIHDFLIKASDFLYQDEANYSLMLGLCENLLSQKTPPNFQPLYFRIEENKKTKAVAVRMGLHLILSKAGLDEIRDLAQHLNQQQVELPGCIGPSAISENFSKAWASFKNLKPSLGMETKLYKLDQVIFPRDISGKFILAQDIHADKIAHWITEFAKDANLPPVEHPTPEQAAKYASRVIDNKSTYFWTVNGHPVCMANSARPTKNSKTVTAVYTPAQFRKKGYASALVAHLCQEILDSGKEFCLLYADQANPTSNKIYQSIGFKEVSETKLFLF